MWFCCIVFVMLLSKYFWFWYHYKSPKLEKKKRIFFFVKTWWPYKRPSSTNSIFKLSFHEFLENWIWLMKLWRDANLILILLLKSFIFGQFLYKFQIDIFKIVLQNMDIFWQKLNIFCVKLIENNPTVVPKIDPFETKEDPKQMNLELRRFIYENVCLDEEKKSCFFVFPWNCLHFYQSLFWMT